MKPITNLTAISMAAAICRQSEVVAVGPALPGKPKVPNKSIFGPYYTGQVDFTAATSNTFATKIWQPPAPSGYDFNKFTRNLKRRRGR